MEQKPSNYAYKKYRFIVWWPCGLYELFTDETQLRSSFPKSQTEIQGIGSINGQNNCVMITNITRSSANTLSSDYDSINKLGVRLCTRSITDAPTIIRGPIILCIPTYIDSYTIEYLSKLHFQGWYDVTIMPIVHELLKHRSAILAFAIPVGFGIIVGKFAL